MKLRKKLLTGLLATALAVSCFFTAGTEVAAAYTPVYTDNYDQYGFDKYGFDKYGIKYDLGTAYNNAKTKMRITEDSSEHLSGGIKVTYNHSASKLVSVKSSSKNLIAKVVANGSSTVSTDTKEYPDGRKEESSEVIYGNEAEIGLYAKKSGNYKVTITSKLPSGALLKKTISIKATSNEPYKFSFANATRKKKADGSYYDTKFYTVKKGKLTVKPAKGYSVTSIKFANSFDDKGEFKYVKITSGTTVSLNTSRTRTAKTVESYSYNGKKYKRTLTDTYTRYYDYIFPVSAVKITYKDTWLGNSYETITYMYYKN